MAVRPTGGRALGFRRARTRRALDESLRRERLLVLRAWRLPGWATPEQRVTLKDQATLNDVLAQLLGRGVPLVEALEVAATTVGPGLRPRVERMRELVSGGSSFADACRAVGGFDEISVSVYAAAERTGDLAGASKELAATARRQLLVAGKAATLMIYPAIVLSVSAVVSVVMLTTIVPTLGEQLADFGAELPLYSRVVMDLGAWMRENIVSLGIGLAAALALLVVVRKQVGAAVGASMRRLPMISSVVLAQEASRFFSVMAAMTRSGIPLADALSVGNRAVGHPALRAQLDRLQRRLVEGGVLRTLIEEVTALPLATRRLLIAAERSGDLESAFAMLAGDMTEEVERRSSRLLAVMGPGVIIVMSVIIGALLFALLLPMLTIAGQAGI